MYKVSETFNRKAEQHRTTLKKRAGNNVQGKKLGLYAMATEHMPPTGQAGYWYEDLIPQVSEYGRYVAHQIARLCGDDTQVTTTIRSLTDAVGMSDKTGTISYAQRGIRELVESGWLSVRANGKGRYSSTTLLLEAGEDTEYRKKWDDAVYIDDKWANHYVA